MSSGVRASTAFIRSKCFMFLVTISFIPTYRDVAAIKQSFNSIASPFLARCEYISPPFIATSLSTLITSTILSRPSVISRASERCERCAPTLSSATVIEEVKPVCSSQKDSRKYLEEGTTFLRRQSTNIEVSTKNFILSNLTGWIFLIGQQTPCYQHHNPMRRRMTLQFQLLSPPHFF